MAYMLNAYIFSSVGSGVVMKMAEHWLMGQMLFLQIKEAYNAEQTYSCTHSYPCYII